MRGVVLAIAALASGCDLVFGGDYVPLDATAVTGDGDRDAVVGDRDEDQIPDNVDNCLDSVNPTQHDEDGDAIGDACDTCPALAGASGDADGDGIGDICDPDPVTATEQWKFFDGFGVDTNYVCPADARMQGFACVFPESAFVIPVANGEMTFDSTGQVLVEDWRDLVPIRRITTKVHATPLANNQDFVRIIARSNSPGTMFENHYSGCGIGRDGVRTKLYIFHANGALVDAGIDYAPWPPPEELELSFTFPITQDAIATCKVSSTAGAREVTFGFPVAERPVTFGVWSYEMTARWHYVAAIGAR